jgi:hypothetical protein
MLPNNPPATEDENTLMEVKKMPDGHSIFAFVDPENPSVYGFRPRALARSLAPGRG